MKPSRPTKYPRRSRDPALVTAQVSGPALLAPTGADGENDGGWRRALVKTDQKKPVYAVGPALSRSRLSVPFALAARSEVFVSFMQAYRDKEPYGVAAATVDSGAPVFLDGGALESHHHLLVTRRVTIANAGAHVLELVMTNRTRTAGHAFAFYGVFAQAVG